MNSETKEIARRALLRAEEMKEEMKNRYKRRELVARRHEDSSEDFRVRCESKRQMPRVFW